MMTHVLVGHGFYSFFESAKNNEQKEKSFSCSESFWTTLDLTALSFLEVIRFAVTHLHLKKKLTHRQSIRAVDKQETDDWFLCVGKEKHLTIKELRAGLRRGAQSLTTAAGSQVFVWRERDKEGIFPSLSLYKCASQKDGNSHCCFCVCVTGKKLGHQSSWAPFYLLFRCLSSRLLHAPPPTLCPVHAGTKNRRTRTHTLDCIPVHRCTSKAAWRRSSLVGRRVEEGHVLCLRTPHSPLFVVALLLFLLCSFVPTYPTHSTNICMLWKQGSWGCFILKYYTCCAKYPPWTASIDSYLWNKKKVKLISKFGGAMWCHLVLFLHLDELISTLMCNSCICKIRTRAQFILPII